MKRHYRILLVLFLFDCSAGLCQEVGNRATDVFPKDFVRHREEARSDTQFNDSTTEATGSKFNGSTNELKKSADIGGIKVTDPSEFDGNDTNVVAVRSVGVLLNIDDSDHVKRHTQELQEFNTKTNIPVSKVYLIGTPENFTKSFSHLIKLGFSAKQEEQYESALVMTNSRYLPNVPDEYAGVEYSPTWLLDTAYGLILVEGNQKKLKSYFDDKGNFKLGKIKLVRE